jgi:DNA modification methylase
MEVTTDQYTLVHADSKAQIRQVPAHSVDLILTDPPYNLSPYSTGNMTFTWRKEINNDLAAWDNEVFDPVDWFSHDFGEPGRVRT